MTDEEKQKLQDKLLAEFEKMLGEDQDEGDFGFYYPTPEDLEYPEEPPPIPKEALETKEQKKCWHRKWKKVYYTHNKAYKMCVDCKKDLGDAE